jgi:riboflavin biosynthesis pyrimidine reductase
MKPYVICHMCTSLDGKIIGHRWGKLRAYQHESELFETTAASFGIGAWMVGTTTKD